LKGFILAAAFGQEISRDLNPTAAMLAIKHWDGYRPFGQADTPTSPTCAAYCHRLKPGLNV
jgi:hypothetical protein